MNRVMLIEDEPPILQMVKGMIESSPHGFVVSQTAYNGRKALKLLEENAEKPDLIVTDIRMPVMDGLQFMKELATQGYDIPCIVLSGYSDFNYAREALQSNACDYLLKPLKEEYLENALAKASSMLRKRKDAAERSYIKKALRLPDDSGTEASNPGYPFYQLMFVREGPHRSGGWEEHFVTSKGRWELNENDLRAGFPKDGNTAPVWWMSGMASNEKIAVRALTDPGSEAMRRDVAESILYQWRVGAVMENLSICLAVAEPVPLDCLAVTLRALREALAQETMIGESKLWVHGDRLRPNFTLTAELEQACRMLVKSAEFRSFQRTMLGWKVEWRREGFGQLAIENLLSTIIRLFQAQWQIEGTSGVATFDANELVSSCRTLDEVVEQFCEYMKEGYEGKARSRSDRSAKDLIKNVQKYLEEHYMEPIGSDTLQEVFSYNRTYISNVFSDVIGIPPGKYLAKLRIDKAIVLLSERRELSLRQIAEQVGYEDSLYFSKVFKNATGLSPKEYKERRERDEGSGA